MPSLKRAWPEKVGAFREAIKRTSSTGLFISLKCQNHNNNRQPNSVPVMPLKYL